MIELNFYDLRTRQTFYSNKYKKIVKMVKGKKRYFAVADAPSGIKSWRIISKSDFDNN